jgi:hypothetical protein
VARAAARELVFIAWPAERTAELHHVPVAPYRVSA